MIFFFLKINDSRNSRIRNIVVVIYDYHDKCKRILSILPNRLQVGFPLPLHLHF